MSLINSLRNYLLEEELKINIFKDKVHISSYSNIDQIDNNSIIVRHNDGFIKVVGQNLTVTKLVIDEILIEGTIKSVELK